MRTAMDTTSLKLRASNRRASSTTAVEWKCNYCNKVFVQEKSFMTHQCKGKRRVEQLKTHTGQAAYATYCEWLKYKKYASPNVNTFMASRYYIGFMKFAEYAERLNIDQSAFVKFISQKHPDITPSLWCSSSVYSLYLSYYDSAHDPWEQVLQSQSFVEKQSEIHECKWDEVLPKIGLQAVIEAFRKKKLSPWFLFTSPIGLSFLKSLDSDDYKTFEKIINCEAWAERFKENRELVTQMQDVLGQK